MLQNLRVFGYESVAVFGRLGGLAGRNSGTTVAFAWEVRGGIQSLVVWQLARDYKRELYALASRPPACLDRPFADHLRKTAASVELNVVEGYHRGTPRDFARFLVIALASLAESRAQLDDGLDRRHFVADDLTRARLLARRAAPALMSLRRSVLRRTG
jgi:four helix bundle protein